jgi:hypothetical protein
VCAEAELVGEVTHGQVVALAQGAEFFTEPLHASFPQSQHSLSMFWINSLTRASLYVNMYAVAYKQVEATMGTVTPAELARLWAQEQLPTERAVGQMLQQLVAMQTTLDRQGHTITELRAQIAELSTRSASNVAASTVQKRGKAKR